MRRKTYFRFAALLLLGACLFSLAGCGHTCTFSEWKLQKNSTCKDEGLETRTCAECGLEESRPVPKKAHDLASNHVCRACKYVDFDPDADIVELANIVKPYYDAGAIANCAWDLAVWNGILYRTAGDYDKNTGPTTIWGYDIANQRWVLSSEVKEEALHRFVVLNGSLTSPGIDPQQGWEQGNYYILNGTAWKQSRNLPGGIHCFDMIEFDGKIFAGLGVEEKISPCVMSTDGGTTFQSIPLYRDGAEVDSTGMTYIRIYEFIPYQNQLYALASFDSDWGIYRFEGDKFTYVGVGSSYIYGSRTNYNYLNAKLEMGGTCFLVSNVLHAVTDFTNPSANKIVRMPNGESVSDALLANGNLYTLTYAKRSDDTYETIIYKSATGEEGSFTEVLRFDYAVPACSFTLDGDYFYIGMGSKRIVNEANGMILRAKIPA